MTRDHTYRSLAELRQRDLLAEAERNRLADQAYQAADPMRPADRGAGRFRRRAASVMSLGVALLAGSGTRRWPTW